MAAQSQMGPGNGPGQWPSECQRLLRLAAELGTGTGTPQPGTNACWDTLQQQTRHLPPLIKEIVRKCCHPDPAMRPSAAQPRAALSKELMVVKKPLEEEEARNHARHQTWLQLEANMHGMAPGASQSWSTMHWIHNPHSYQDCSFRCGGLHTNHGAFMQHASNASLAKKTDAGTFIKFALRLQMSGPMIACSLLHAKMALGQKIFASLCMRCEFHSVTRRA